MIGNMDRKPAVPLPAKPASGRKRAARHGLRWCGAHVHSRSRPAHGSAGPALGEWAVSRCSVFAPVAWCPVGPWC